MISQLSFSGWARKGEDVKKSLVNPWPWVGLLLFSEIMVLALVPGRPLRSALSVVLILTALFISRLEKHQHEKPFNRFAFMVAVGTAIFLLLLFLAHNNLCKLFPSIAKGG